MSERHQLSTAKIANVALNFVDRWYRAYISRSNFVTLSSEVILLTGFGSGGALELRCGRFGRVLTGLALGAGLARFCSADKSVSFAVVVWM